MYGRAGWERECGAFFLKGEREYGLLVHSRESVSVQGRGGNKHCRRMIEVFPTVWQGKGLFSGNKFAGSGGRVRGNTFWTLSWKSVLGGGGD